MEDLPGDEQGKPGTPLCGHILNKITNPSAINFVPRGSKRRQILIATLQRGSPPVEGAPKIMEIKMSVKQNVPKGKRSRRL